MTDSQKDAFVLNIIPKLQYEKRIKNSADFCAIIGWDETSLSQMRKGMRHLPEKKFVLMLEKFSLQGEWFTFLQSELAKTVKTERALMEVGIAEMKTGNLENQLMGIRNEISGIYRLVEQHYSIIEEQTQTINWLIGKAKKEK